MFIKNVIYFDRFSLQLKKLHVENKYRNKFHLLGRWRVKPKWSATPSEGGETDGCNREISRFKLEIKPNRAIRVVLPRNSPP